MTDSPTTYVAYASFGARLRALVIDTAIVAAWIVLLVVGGDVARDVPGSGRVTVALLLGVAFLYEPRPGLAMGRHFLMAAFVVMSILMGVLVTPACLDEIACTPAETLVVDVISLSWVAASVILIIAGWRGRVWGARATRTADTPESSAWHAP